MARKRRKPEPGEVEDEAKLGDIHWGCPRCGCQAARRAVKQETWVPVVFCSRRVTRFVDRAIGRGAGRYLRSIPHVRVEGVPVAMGEESKELLSRNFLDSYECVNCGLEFTRPKRLRC